MAAVVYVLCFLTSLACGVLLLRGFLRSRVRLLLWSGLAFVGLAINNGILFVDRIIVPTMDLSIFRSLPAVIGMLLLLYGLIWEEE